MSIDEIMALADEYVSASIEAHGYRSGAASAEYLEDTKRKLLAALESLIAAPAAPQRNREADRARYTDPAFNEWLDDSVADGGATVWDLVPDVHSAWFAWTAHPNYAAPQQVEPVAWMKPTRDSCYLRSAETMLAIHEDFDGIARTGWTPLYLHPPAAEVQMLRAAARDVCEWADAAQWALGNETGVPAAKLDALRKALEGGE